MPLVSRGRPGQFVTLFGALSGLIWGWLGIGSEAQKILAFGFEIFKISPLENRGIGVVPQELKGIFEGSHYGGRQDILLRNILDQCLQIVILPIARWVCRLGENSQLLSRFQYFQNRDIRFKKVIDSTVFGIGGVLSLAVVMPLPASWLFWICCQAKGRSAAASSRKNIKSNQVTSLDFIGTVLKIVGNIFQAQGSVF